MLLDQRPEVLLFELTDPTQGCKYEAPFSDDLLVGFTNPAPQNVAGHVGRRTNRIPAEAPSTAKSKTKVQIRPGKGKEKERAEDGDGGDKDDGHSDDEGRRRGRRGSDDGGARTVRAPAKKRAAYRALVTWTCVSLIYLHY
jgi:hypothetical protein